MPFVSIQQASFGFTNHAMVVASVDWEIAAGEFHCLLGRSGCGKTTLLKLVAGLIQAQTGAVCIDSSPVLDSSQEVGFVFQSPTLLEWLTTLDNVLLPISLHRKPTTHDIETARRLLAFVGLGSMLKRYPAELSGGQQSRVAIARALVRQPKLLLMDEPFAALDALTREELQDDLLALCATRNTTTLFVTHDISEAVYLADRVAVMADGKICHAIDIALERPRTQQLRYEPTFNALCRAARASMDATT